MQVGIGAGHEIGKKIRVPSEFVLAIQEYFGLTFSLLFGHPKYLLIFFACQFTILACHSTLGTLLFCTPKYHLDFLRLWKNVSAEAIGEFFVHGSTVHDCMLFVNCSGIKNSKQMKVLCL